MYVLLIYFGKKSLIEKVKHKLTYIIKKLLTRQARDDNINRLHRRMKQRHEEVWKKLFKKC